MNSNVINTIVNGMSNNLTDVTKDRILKSIEEINRQLEDTKTNRSSKTAFQSSTNSSATSSNIDPDLYTNISDMINGVHTDNTAGFGTLLDNLAIKNKRYFTIIKDYEIMPILIPQINRVLMFLVNECLSPDVQNEQTFTITYLSDKDTHHIQASIDAIKKEMKLDAMLREVYENRYKLGNEYYTVIDYDQTFNHTLEMMQQQGIISETVDGTLSDIKDDTKFIQDQFSLITEHINECTVTVPISVDRGNQKKVTENVSISLKDMNIILEKSSLPYYMEQSKMQVLSESYAGLSRKNLMKQSLNEAYVDMTKMGTLIQTMKAKKINRCTIERLDPSRIFKLKIGGRVIGYFYVRDINENDANVINLAQALKDQLLKTKAANMDAANKTAEEIISQQLAEMIINKFDPNIGINRIEDIDLLHDYIRNCELYRGNKRIIFYYEDEIFDMSRTNGSLLTNAVFFTKLYSTLLLNNIMTKVLRGRGRQIHMVKVGVSPNMQRYIQNAMMSLTMPENNLGTLHGSFEQILNPFNASSDIVFPVEDTSDRFIETDYIPGQDINMDDDFLRFLLNSIISAFGLDSAVIDATNGNLQFARTLSMESLQICNAVRNEQQDLHDAWENLCLEVLRIMGDDNIRDAIDQGMIKVNFYEPESLIIQNTIEELNNAKSYAENIADLIPEFNEEGSDLKRMKFIYSTVKDRLNIDWTTIENLLDELDITQIDDNLKNEARQLIRQYKDNTEEQLYGDSDQDGILTKHDQDINDEYGDFDSEEY